MLAATTTRDPCPLAQKRAVTIGMAMTERQGGSDLRANSSRARDRRRRRIRARADTSGSARRPMSDAFFTLANTDAGLTCFFVPRSLPDGTRNPFLIQRLKDKCGNRSNASSEIEYRGTRAWIVGEEGRGIATLIEMAHLTRFDIVVGLRRDDARGARTRRCTMPRTAAPSGSGSPSSRSCRTCSPTSPSNPRLRRCSPSASRAPSTALESDAREAAPDAHHDARSPSTGCASACPPFVGGGDGMSGRQRLRGGGALARLYREAPLNGIWEGSGNVICLDALRSIEREPESLGALLDEIRPGRRALAAGGRRRSLNCSRGSRAWNSRRAASSKPSRSRFRRASWKDTRRRKPPMPFCASRPRAPRRPRAFGTLAHGQRSSSESSRRARLAA